MSENKAKLSDSLKKNVTPKNFKKNPIKGTKYTIMVSSAKGGVGKSTFAINLTFALQKKGKKVGLLDADIHGPSLPKMIGLNDKPKTDGKFLFPLEKYGAQFMSLGFLVDEKTPMIWRGPMVISAIKTLTEKVAWKDLDYLIVDMPPGTGDTQLTFAQDVKIDGAIIVSTPQELALMDVQRGIHMFDKTKIKIVGLVDNMSFFETEDGKKHNIFGEGGVEKTAKEFNKNFLGKIPISTKLRESADLGLPLTYKEPGNEISKVFLEIANKVMQDVA
ncbi:Mrp/NBP35 family ATP-binding protein [bacterium]|nr:Mrp/NBP35 family ATP-binding protein [bacterium]